MQYIEHGNYPTQNNYESHPRSLSILCEKALFHLFDYYFDGKQELGLLEMNLKHFTAVNPDGYLQVFCTENDGKQDPELQLTFYDT